MVFGAMGQKEKQWTYSSFDVCRPFDMYGENASDEKQIWFGKATMANRSGPKLGNIGKDSAQQ